MLGSFEYRNYQFIKYYRGVSINPFDDLEIKEVFQDIDDDESIKDLLDNFSLNSGFETCLLLEPNYYPKKTFILGERAERALQLFLYLLRDRMQKASLNLLIKFLFDTKGDPIRIMKLLANKISYRIPDEDFKVLETYSSDVTKDIITLDFKVSTNKAFQSVFYGFSKDIMYKPNTLQEVYRVESLRDKKYLEASTRPRALRINELFFDPYLFYVNKSPDMRLEDLNRMLPRDSRIQKDSLPLSEDEYENFLCTNFDDILSVKDNLPMYQTDERVESFVWGILSK